MAEITRSQARRTLLEKELRRYLPLLQQHYHPHKIILFGSMVGDEIGEWTDLDLVVVAETDKRFLDRYDDLLGEIAQVVSGRDVDLLIYTPQELARLADRPFIKRALSQGRVIYESKQESISR